MDIHQAEIIKKKLDSDYQKNLCGEQGYSRNLDTLRIIENGNIGNVRIIEFFGQHALRHTFATRCIEAGIAPVVLKKWMGHTNIHITLDTYADVFDRMYTDSVEKFDTLMEQLERSMKGK